MSETVYSPAGPPSARPVTTEDYVAAPRCDHCDRPEDETFALAEFRGWKTWPGESGPMLCDDCFATATMEE